MCVPGGRPESGVGGELVYRGAIGKGVELTRTSLTTESYSMGQGAGRILAIISAALSTSHELVFTFSLSPALPACHGKLAWSDLV